MKKRVIIIHGWEGSPQGDWLPWLKEQLEDIGHEVVIPEMPNANHPVLCEWLPKVYTTIGKADKNTYLVGHSLGVITILRYLESLTMGDAFGGVILVAGFPEPIGYKELDSFFKKSLDYGKIKKTAKKFIAIQSDNDPEVSMKNGEMLRDSLNAELITIHNGGHLSADTGYTELPIVFDKLKELGI